MSKGFLSPLLGLVLNLTYFAALPLSAQAAQIEKSQTSPLRVVILPFQNISANKDDAWLSDSFSESLTMGLIKVESLQLIERSQLGQVMKEQQFGQSALVDESSAPMLGKLLGAEVVILGSFQKVGTELQANVRFVRVETGKIERKWATQVEGSFQDLFRLQKDLARQLIAQMPVKASEQDVQKLEKTFAETSSTDAHRFYLEGLQKQRMGLPPQEAIRSFKASLAADPNYALAYAGLADAYSQLAAKRRQLVVLPPAQGFQVKGPGDEALAEQYAQQALALNPELPLAWSALARLEQSRGNRDRALELSTKAMRINPRDTGAQSAYIETRIQQANIDIKALRADLKSLGANFDDPWLKFNLASIGILQEAFRMQPDFGWIEKLLDEAALDLPENPFVPLAKLGVLVRLQRNDEALTLLKRVEQMGAESPEVLNGLASFYNALGQHEKALEVIDRALKISPDDFDLLVEKADILSGMQDFEASEKLYQSLEARRPGDTWLEFSRGLMYLGLGQAYLPKSQEYLKRALAHWPQNPRNLSRTMILQMLGTVYLMQDALNEARPIYQELLSDPSYYGEAYQVLAGIYASEENYAGALEAFSDYLKIDSQAMQNPEKQLKYRWFYLLKAWNEDEQNVNILNDLGQTAIQLGNYGGARRFLTEGLRLAPENPTLQYNFAVLAMQEEKWPEAQSALEKAVKLRPDYLKAWFNLGLVYQAQGQKTQARQALQRVLELDGSHTEARAQLQILLKQ
ncbi:hypothetical protein COW36_19985 [bacterium (Candidatus Blackallbacteria) CG17_big_fil_post_rev_8_21_14_2_50_48_46]|uniref:Uncharacterized protein n=1 Tax=bacterium (Candidatus Blackallbacteria) CG17_big_fil_post_rev_8_21_14_2_50_48_46 TaxID=2014261 RepID=A0A2M7G006_9BACT|nr:MAG: hypothetical protein COW64_15310 [bacterium (Candidatus Blackallbacteria) CG18_big_fil_WC_8_21_14_2_50_49_26]PIW14929.1 MAG: hypothetical protein COW36_19985 [bacterium (Candidatus Blackallbacteria) CG17_big_fil_post_rev_8_21_14_2_50_48_46]PIW44283.1 MAG: hypothetical protein COW20_24375 [bacterium (Candidatus Blackallbacteria) CG13_big_fil_rev_8_21_14_2_50_49_14]